jgi:CRISPR/Cas system-associated exonuclease Cas4 (RecB family)
MIYQDLMTKCLKETLTEMKQESFGKLRASGLGNCPRKLWYGHNKTTPWLLTKYNNAEDKEQWLKNNLTSARVHLVFGLGHLIEEQLIGLLGDKISDAQKECKLTIAGAQIIGHIDGIYTDENKNKWVVDFKSINTRGFKYKIARNDSKTEIDYKYLCQANFYMKALNIPRFIFVFYNKDTSIIKELFIEQNDNIILDIEKRVIKAVSKTPPNKEYHPKEKQNGWNCSYCSYFDTCWKGEYEMIVENGKPKVIETVK